MFYDKIEIRQIRNFPNLIIELTSDDAFIKQRYMKNVFAVSNFMPDVFDVGNVLLRYAATMDEGTEENDISINNDDNNN